MVYLRIGNSDFTINELEIKSDQPKVQEFLEKAKEFFFKQDQHQDDPDMLLADYFINALGAVLTKYDTPPELQKIYDNPDLIP